MNAPSLSPVLVSIDKLHPDPTNARKHSERNVQAIAASLKMFGQRRPIVVQKSSMIVRAGNGLLQAAKALGWTEVVALVVDDDNATAAQFAIADNRTAELAEWDWSVLADTLMEWEPHVAEKLGWNQTELESLLSINSEADGMTAEELLASDAEGQDVAKQQDLAVVRILIDRKQVKALRAAIAEQVANLGGRLAE